MNSETATPYACVSRIAISIQSHQPAWLVGEIVFVVQFGHGR